MILSWAAGRHGMAGYMLDENAEKRSQPRLLQYVRDVVEGVQPGGKVHLMAHSMGNRLMFDTLKDLHNMDSALYQGRLGQVISCAPDVDAQQRLEEVPLQGG